MSVQADDPLWTVNQAAEFLQMGVNTLYIGCRRNEIPHFKIGASLRFRRVDLEAWLAANRRGPAEAAG